MKKTILLLIMLITICLIGTCIYFVDGVSATLPPIEKFESQENMTELIAKLKALNTIKPNLNISYSNLLGNKSNGFAYDIEIRTKYNSQDLLYEIKIQSETQKDSKTELLLIGAHNLTNNTGGYGVKATGINVLLDRFMLDVIEPLNDKGMTLILEH